MVKRGFDHGLHGEEISGREQFFNLAQKGVI